MLTSAPTLPRCEESDSMTAVLLSLAVPGFGQLYEGEPGYAKLFIAAELALWGAWWYNAERKDTGRADYLGYAAIHAGVNPERYGTDYLNAIGAYDSSFDHNAAKSMRKSYPVHYNGVQAWEWDDVASRLRFRNLRERELDYENNLKFCVAGVVLNHFLSALHASRLAHDEAPVSAMTVSPLDGGLKTTWTRSF
jgi:hypothetical protein